MQNAGFFILTKRLKYVTIKLGKQYCSPQFKTPVMLKDTRLTLSEARGPLEKFIDVLSGENAEYWVDVFNKVMRKEDPFESEYFRDCEQGLIIESFRVEVDGTKTLECLIGQGNYRFTDADINEENFPIKNKTKRTEIIELFHFIGGKTLTPNGPVTNAIIHEMNRHGSRPANVEELLGLGITYPELQLRSPITIIGKDSAWLTNGRGGDYAVPLLSSNNGKRLLGKNIYCYGVWGISYRFAAVRK